MKTQAIYGFFLQTGLVFCKTNQVRVIISIWRLCFRTGNGIEIDKSSAADQQQLMLTGSCLFLMNLSLAVYYFKLSAGQKDSRDQLSYTIGLYFGKSVPIDESAAARSCQLAIDQRHCQPQFLFAHNQNLGSYCFRMTADGGDLHTHLTEIEY
jgi:hypothetical protein